MHRPNPRDIIDGLAANGSNIKPSLFLKEMIGAPLADILGLMNPFSKSSFTCFFSYAILGTIIVYKGKLMGVNLS